MDSQNTLTLLGLTKKFDKIFWISWNIIDEKLTQLINFSRAILCYLVNKFGRECPEKCELYPTDPEARALVDRLLFFDNGTLYKNIVDYFVS